MLHLPTAHTLPAAHTSLPHVRLSGAKPPALSPESGTGASAGYEVSRWVFLTDESSAAAEAQGWGVLAVRLHAAPETLDFPAGTDVGCIISMQ